MTLSAYVQSCSESSGKTLSECGSGGVVAIAQQLMPAWVEIVQDEAGVSLFRYCSEGNYIADTWHKSLEEAKRQAEYEFGITDEHWFEE